MSILAAFALPHPPIMLPEIGRGEERGMQNTIDAYREAMRRAAELKPDTVIVSTPHSILYSDYFHISPGSRAEGDFGAFRAPGIKVRAQYDTAFVSHLESSCAQEGISAGTLGEENPKLDHGTMLPLLALNEFWKEYKLVRLSLSGLSPTAHYALGQCIARTAESLNRRAVFLASGDLSHKLKEDGPYGFAPEGPQFDRAVADALGKGDFLQLLDMDTELSESAAVCGLRSFWILAGVLDRTSITSELLSYEGPFGVGYAVAAFSVTGDDPAKNYGEQFAERTRKRIEARRASEGAHVRLARRALEAYVTTGRTPELPSDLPEELYETRAGAFVSLKKHGQLRGCIGTIEATQPNLALEIIQNAVSASRDPRFEPVEPDELSELVYSVDVLGKPEPIASEKELDVKRYGVIVEDGARRGLLLPDLPGVDTPREQIEIARKKAGIAPDKRVKLYRFDVVRHT